MKIRSIGKFVLGILFSLSLAITIISFIAWEITSYETSVLLFKTVIKNTIKPEAVNQTYEYFTYYCKDHDYIALPFGEENLTIECEAFL